MKGSFYIAKLILLVSFTGFFANAQIAVTNFPPYDNEANLVTNVLLGDGILASNYSSVGFANGIGYFDGFASNIGFEEGVILSTGGLELVTTGFGVGSGVSGDADLELALNAINLTWDVNNVTILEFDFIAESESMAFNYVFGSVEYTSFTCSNYNDIFGFFLSGPGIAGPYSNNAINLAYIPDPANPGEYTTTPVAVNTVNNGDPNEDFGGTCENIDPNWESYNIYWIDNDYTGTGWQGVNVPPSPEFTVEGITGFTTPLTAEYDGLVCGETYHIKLAIADAADGALNSAVFLEANSFASPEVSISTVPNTELGLVIDVDNGVLEGCGQAALQFDRGGDLSMEITMELEYSGTSQYGVDYAALPTEVILPAFQEQFVLPVNVFYDEINEGQETLIITVSGVPVACQEGVETQSVELILFDQEELVINMPDQINIDCLGAANIEAEITGGYVPYNYTWYDQFGVIIESGELLEEGSISITQDPEETTMYTLVVTDGCLDQLVDSSTDVIVEDQVLNVVLGDDILVCEDDLGGVVLSPEVGGGVSPYEYTWFYNGVVISNAQSLSNIPGDGLYQLITEEACGTISGDEIEVSYISPSPYVELISYDVLDPSLLPESCFESILQFNLLEPQDEDMNLEFYVGGSAQINIDYSVVGVNNPESIEVVIPAGSESLLVPISIIQDNVEEGLESIEFNFPFIDPCSDWPSQLSIQIYEPSPLQTQLDDELILCDYETDTGLLEGFFSGGVGLVNYSWYYENGLISTEMDISSEDLVAGVYSFVAVDQCGNSSTSTIDYGIIQSTPTVTLSSVDYDNPSEMYEGCGSSVLVFEMPYPYSEDMIFEYSITGSPSFFNGIDIQEINNYINVPAGVTDFEVEIEPLFDTFNEDIETILFEFPFSTDCVPQQSIEVNINNYYPIEIILPNQPYVCAGQELELAAEYIGGMPPFTVSWSYLNEASNEDGINFNVEEGVFPATFTVSDDCGFSASSTIQVEGIAVDNFEVVWPPNEVFACFGDNSQITLGVEGGIPPYEFQWFLDGVETNALATMLPWSDDYWQASSSQMIPTLPPYAPYIYNYQVLVTDSCSNQIEYDIAVTVDDCILPTAFTPNADGNNDVFGVDFGDLVGPVSLEVFNRWGTLVFRSEDYTQCANFSSGCWDGTHFQQYGQECSEGVYYYVFTYSHPIYNVDSYNVSDFVEGTFGVPRDRNLGRQRTGSIMLFR